MYSSQSRLERSDLDPVFRTQDGESASVDDPSMFDQPVIADRLDHHQAVNVDVQLC